MKKIKVVVTGAAGRMGQTIIKKVLRDKGLKLVGALEISGHKNLGQDIGKILKTKNLGIKISDNIINLFANTDAVIDFTLPNATVDHAKYAAQARIVHVIGTTGLSNSQLKKIENASKHATIIKSGNMSLGVNLLETLVRQAASKLDTSFNIQINEEHHKHKIDAPSGTAFMLGNAAAKGRNLKLDKVKKISRLNTKGSHSKDKIVFTSFRKGEIVGNHEVIFSSPDEIINFQHKANNRGIFASGAIYAVKWGQDKKPGLFSMVDVLGL